MKDAKNRAIEMKKSEPQFFQVSKEYVGGKWQKVGFYKTKTGNVKLKKLGL